MKIKIWFYKKIQNKLDWIYGYTNNMIDYVSPKNSDWYFHDDDYIGIKGEVIKETDKACFFAINTLYGRDDDECIEKIFNTWIPKSVIEKEEV